MAERRDPSLPGDEVFAGVLDWSVMEQLLSLDDGETGLLEEMLVLYREDTPDRIKAMEHTLALGDLADMADVAHAIKGAASTMGAPKVRDLAAELEAAGRLGKGEVNLALTLEALKEAYDESAAALVAFLASKQS